MSKQFTRTDAAGMGSAINQRRIRNNQVRQMGNVARTSSSDQLPTQSGTSAFKGMDTDATGRRFAGRTTLSQSAYEKYGTLGVGGDGRRKYEYPLDNRDEYSARIVFKVIREDRRKTTDAIKTLLDQAVEVEQQITASVVSEEEDTNFERGRTSGSGTIAESAKRKIIEKERLMSLYGDVGETESFSEANLKTGAQCSLYLPKGIAINDGVEYDTGFQLGMIGGVAEQAMNDGGRVLGALAGAALDTGVNTAKAIMGSSSLSPATADLLAQKVATNFGATGQAVAGGMKAASKITTNPNTRAIFKDVPLRSFGFNFSLIPTSATENQEIQDIIKFFRTELYPVTLQAGGIRVGYQFPNRFLIKLKHRNNQDINLKFLPVYLQSFNATYNANSALMYEDGGFNSVDIQMQFTETRALTKADVRDGGY